MTGNYDGQVYSEAVRKSYKLKMASFSLIAMLSGMVAVITLLQPISDSMPGIYLLGLFVGFGIVTKAARDFVQSQELRFQKNLRPLVQKKVEALHGVDLSQAVFVGYSPGDTLRSYNGDSAWDVGFILWDGSTIYYLGDVTDFAIQGSQIRSVDFLGSSPGLPMALPKVIVSWEDQPTGQSGRFQLDARNISHRKDAADSTVHLAQNIENIHRDWLHNQQPSTYNFTYRSDVTPPLAPEVKSTRTGPVGCIVWIGIAFLIAILLSTLSYFLKLTFQITWLESNIIRFVIFFMIMMTLERIWLWFRTQ